MNDASEQQIDTAEEAKRRERERLIMADMWANVIYEQIKAREREANALPKEPAGRPQTTPSNE